MKAALSSGALRRSNRALTAPLPPRCFRTHPMSTASNVKASRHGYRLIGGAACALGAAFFAGITAQNPVHAAAPTPATSTAFNKKEWTAYPLMDKVKLNHNTTLLRFKLPEGVTAGLTVASMLSVGFRPAGESATENDKVTARPYTPTSRTQDKGFIEFVIKAYPAPGGVGKSERGRKPLVDFRLPARALLAPALVLFLVRSAVEKSSTFPPRSQGFDSGRL